MSIIPDPEYDFVKPYAMPDLPPKKKGSQCGQCGMKFDYGQIYGYCCGHNNCPMGHGPFAFGGDMSSSDGSHLAPERYTNPFDDGPRDLYMCKICNAGDALTPSKIEHADGCLLASDSAPGGCDVSD